LGAVIALVFTAAALAFAYSEARKGAAKHGRRTRGDLRGPSDYTPREVGEWFLRSVWTPQFWLLALPFTLAMCLALLAALRMLGPL
jgi:hypothetical protein